MPYLTAAQAAAQGLTATDAQIASAAAVIDAYLKRPEGVLYVSEADGSPCYMAGATPTGSLTLTTPLAIGAGNSAAVSGWVTPDMVGEVLIAEVGLPSVEALVVTAVNGQVLTFGTVKRAHSGTLTRGLCITEQKALPARRSITQVSRPPLARLVAGQGRYGVGRRSRQSAGVSDFNLVSTIATFTGGVPYWQAFSVADASVGANGEVWIPSGLLMDFYTDVRLTYVAGYPQENVPAALQAAVASVLTTLQTFPEFSGNLKSLAAGGTKLERFADQALDADTRNMLAPFMARAWA